MDEEVPKSLLPSWHQLPVHPCQFHISLSVPSTKDHIWKEKKSPTVPKALLYKLLGSGAHRQRSDFRGSISWEEGHCK